MTSYKTITPTHQQPRRVRFPLGTEQKLAEIQDTLQIQRSSKVPLTDVLSHVIGRYNNY